MAIVFCSILFDASRRFSPRASYIIYRAPVRAPISAFLSTRRTAPHVHARLPSLVLELREASLLDKGL